MIRLVVFTAALGVTDRLQPPAVIDPNVRYVCFSDTPCTVKPYQWVPVPPADDPKFESRRIKILADHPALDGDVTVWHDASYRLLTDLRWAAQAVKRADHAAMRHPRRLRIEQEAVAVARYGYLKIDQALAYVAEYRAAGYQDDGVITSGLMVRRTSPTAQAFNRLWWREVERWRGRDQPSHGFAIWRAGLTSHILPGSVKANTYAAFRVPLAVPA